MPKKSHYPNVNKVKGPNGAEYLYHRKTGERLPGPYGSKAFKNAWVQAENAADEPSKIKESETYGGLIAAFKSDDVWKHLRPRTQADYQKVIDWMYEQGAREKPAAGVPQSRCEKLVDKAKSEKWHRFAVSVLQFNRRLYNWVLKRHARQKLWGASNPWANVEMPRPPRRPSGAVKKNRPWAPEEVATVLLEAPLGLARAYVLGASGFDGGTMFPLGWEHYHDGEFDPERVKTLSDGAIVVPGVFRPFLDRGHRPSPRIVTTELGEPFSTVGSLQTQSSKFLRTLAAQEKVKPGLTMHGLRHTVGKAVADSGGGVPAIQAALQHKSARMALHYSSAADKRRALRNVSDELSAWFDVQKDLQKVVDLKEARPKFTKKNNG